MSKKHLLISIILLFLFVFALTACDDEADGAASGGAYEPPESTPANFDEIQSGFTAFDPRVEMIEINQSLSYGFDTDTGKFFLIDHFAAGKETAIFVSFNEPVNTVLGNQTSCYLNITKDGDTVTQLTWVDYYDENTLYFQPKNMADVGSWSEGAYTFELYLEDDTLAAARTTNFYDAKEIKILAVPVLTNYSGNIYSCTSAWQSASDMIYATFPTAKTNITYTLGPELDMSGVDITTDDGMYDLWDMLRKLQTPNNDYTVIVGFIPYPIEVRDGEILGYTYELPAVIVSEDNSEMMNTIIHEIAHCYGVGDEYEGGSMNTKVNTPPYQMSGQDMFSYRTVYGEKEHVLRGFEKGVNGEGSMIYPEQRPFYVEGRKALPNVSSYMGSGTDAEAFEKWVSSEIWIHLFRSFTGQSGGAVTSGAAEPSGGGGGTGGSEEFWDDYWDDGSSSDNDYDDVWVSCPNCCACIQNPEVYVECEKCWSIWEASASDTKYNCNDCGTNGKCSSENLYVYCDSCEYLISIDYFESFNSKVQSGGSPNMQMSAGKMIKAIEITGYIDSDDGSFTPLPWYVYEENSSELITRKEGDYGVYFYDERDRMLYSSFFNVNFGAQITTTEGTTYLPQSKAPVSVITRFPDYTAKIVIFKDQMELYSTTVSKADPMVSFIGLNENDRLGDSVTLMWDASGEKEELFFDIWYCPAEDDFYNIATNITGRSYEADLSSYPGTNEGYFYIYASDGVRTGESASATIKVPFKAPEFISTQESIPEVKITEEICFDAEIYDMQDGWLWDEEVVWTLDEKEFVTGSFLWVWPYELAPGDHTFTCTATNSEGLSTQKDFTFRILDDESDLPDDWSREDIKNALANGFVTSINKLDAPITRGQYATLMTTLYWSFLYSDDPLPDYIENVVNDCGQDDYDQFLMVHLGVMEAKDGKFEPARPLTEKEAATIMYRIVDLADPELLEEYGPGEADIMEFYSDYGIIDKNGPNEYQGAENLTNRLALVRLSRLFDVFFE